MKIKKISYVIISCIFLLLNSSLGLANSAMYQVDIVVFIHEPINENQKSILPIFAINSKNTIMLGKNNGHKYASYQLLPSKASHLQRQYWALSHKQNYHVIANYSWLQPVNNQNTVSIPKTIAEGWSLEGNIRVRQSNYYLINTELLFTKQDREKISFIFSKSTRLKPGVTYYLDHPSAGMLIQVKKLSVAAK